MVLYLRSDSNKTEQVLELFETLLKENNDLLIETVHETLLHSIAQWHLDNDLDFMALNNSRLEDLVKHCQNLLEDEMDNESSLQNKLKTIYNLLPYIMQLLQRNEGNSVSTYFSQILIVILEVSIF